MGCAPVGWVPGMTRPVRVRVAGYASLGVEPEIPGPLDELIYEATSAAIADAGLTIGDIDGVCMAASDVLDGRGISTMTLTGSTGSFRKTELRVCDDALAAVRVAAAEIASGAERTLMVCAWSKLSDAQPSAMAPLTLEPVFHRDLIADPVVVRQLRESEALGHITVTRPSETWPADTAVAMVLTADREATSGKPALVGFGASMGPYLRPGEDLTAPLADAVQRACDMAGCDRSELRQVYIVGVEALGHERVRAALALVEQPIVDLEWQGADVGYAAGLLALCAAARSAPPGRSLAASVSGVGMQSANAVIMEVA